MKTLIVALTAACLHLASAYAQTPTFRVDPGWPRPLPEENGVRLVLGQVAGIALDERNGHVWIIHRPATLLADEWNVKESRPVTHAAGNYLRGWAPSDPKVQWPKSEHGIYIDPEGNVWLAGNAEEDHQILKFTPEGKFLMQIGHGGKSEGSNSRTQLGRPAHMVMEPKAQELYVADGAYKRHWGAYGGEPNDDRQPPYDPNQPASRQFGNPVHCVRLSSDARVYVCDRANDRIQVFEPSGKFLHEFRVEPLTRANGSVWDMALSHDAAQKFMYIADGANGRVYVLNCADGAQLSSFGRTGRMAGEFKWVHNIAIDRQGNLYTSEVGFGRRVQKFNLVSF
jgi:sugar lactone lactonase YvrE